MLTALIAYFCFLILVVAVNSAVIYHFTKYHFPRDATKLVVFFYSVIMLAVVAITIFLVGII